MPTVLEREQSLINTLDNLRQSQDVKDLFDIIRETGGPEDTIRLVREFGNAASDRKVNVLLEQFHDLVEEARYLEDVKGPHLADEISEFLRAADSLSDDEFNNVFAFVAKVIVPDQQDRSGPRQNPMSP